MFKTQENSRIEVWCTDYINKARERTKQDEKAIIIQIEHSINNDYIVEVVDE